MAALIPELYVSNLEKSLAFYSALGFQIAYRRPAEYFARIARGDAEIMLEEPRGRTWLIGPLTTIRGIGVNLQISVTGADGLFATLCMEAKIILEPETRTYQREDDAVTVRQFVIADRDGYLLRFSEVLAVKPARPPATP